MELLTRLPTREQADKKQVYQFMGDMVGIQILGQGNLPNRPLFQDCSSVSKLKEFFLDFALRIKKSALMA